MIQNLRFLDTIKGITEKYCNHAVLEDELSKDEYGKETRKHLLQTSSIIGILEAFGLLRPDCCYVEFGAGKGLRGPFIQSRHNSH